jgi:hypothetical protein
MKLHPNIECLECRIAPASIITFTDVDGDLVKVKSSKGTLEGKLSFTEMGAGQQLNLINLTDPAFQGANLVIKVKKGATGDGFANIGFIDATGVNLGKVIIPGDLGGIDAGDGNTATPAIKKLNVKSMGAFGTATQASDGGGDGGDPTPDFTGVVQILTQLISTATGSANGLLGILQTELQTLLSGDGLIDTALERLAAGLASNIRNLLGLGSATVEELGDATRTLLANIAVDLKKLLDSGEDLPPTLTSLLENVSEKVNEVLFTISSPLGLGGSVLDATANIQAVIAGLALLIGADIQAGIPQGLLNDLQTAIDAVASSGEGGGGLGGLIGGIIGGVTGPLETLVANVSSAITQLLSDPAAVTLDAFVGDLVELEASVQAALTDPNLSQVVRNLLGSVQAAIGDILDLPQVLLHGVSGHLGSLLEGLENDLPGGILPGTQQLIDNIVGLIGRVQNGLSDVLSSGGNLASTLLRDLALLQTNLASLLGTTIDILGAELTQQVQTVVTDILRILGTPLIPGGGGEGSVPVLPSGLQSDIKGNIGKLKVVRDISGVFINVQGSIKTIAVGGSLIGGISPNSGEIFVTGDVNKTVISKNILGGLNLNSGLLQANGALKKVKIGGSIVGGTGNSSGELLMNSDSKSVVVRGDLIGNLGLFAASIDNTNGRIGKVKIGGSVIAGFNIDSGSIRVMGDVRQLTIKGNVIGDEANPVFISAAATKAPTDQSNIAFKNVKIGGKVSFANILAGYDTDLNAVNGRAQIGKVMVGNDWIASNLIAGATTESGTLANFGAGGDVPIPMGGAGPEGLVSKIASIQIKGLVAGTATTPGDHYGFVAQEIGKFKLGRNVLSLNAGSGNDAMKVSPTTGSDVGIFELGAAYPASAS